MEQSKKRGFTLLELLIVITILAILTLVVILFINPVEILKKSRDVQRLSDLATMKTAIAVYLQDRGSNNLGGTTYCITGTTASETFTLNTSPHISIADTTPLTGATFITGGTDCTASGGYNATTTADQFKNNGVGWMPYINFTTMAGGAPIERLPVDPVNTATGSCGVDSLYYRYVCKTNQTFEIDATLESDAYKLGGTDSKPNKDGGNSEMRYEVGTDLNLLPSSAPVGFGAL